ncbi:MAG TPA: hypothetical protein PKD90_04325, partial [Phnomibacter sp.]|nr:hypothetical protein [Phnomibacter sp.]
QYPHNSTVLNNLGQAWLALGEAALADKYLDSALQIFPAHVQAHLAKAKIAESKGNTAKAAEHMEQAMQESYSAEKENALRKYGKKASGKNIKLPGTMPADPLGLEKFNWPAYPSTVKESLPLAEEWQRFKEAISKERSQLQLQQQMARKAAEERSAHFMKEAAANAGNPAFDATQLAPPFAQAAALKLKYYLDDDYGGLNKSMIRAQNQLLEVRKQVAALGMQRDSIYKALSKKYEPLIGDGRPNPLDEYCQEHTEATNQFLKAANTLLMQAQASYLEVVRKQINNMVYYSQYTNWPEHFEAIKAGAKADWLNQIASQRVEFGELGPFCKQEKEHNSAHANLSNFDDVACQYHSTLDLVVFEITASCSRLFGKLKLGNVEYTRKVDMDQDKLLAATLEISAGRSIGASKGPVAGEAKAEIKGRLEWNDTRVTNWTVEASAGVSVGSNLGVGDKSIDIAGVTAQIGMNSGPSLQGSGMLRSIQVK